MPATFVTEAELRSALGIGNLYSSAVVEEVCQTAENVVKSYLWFNKAYVAATKLTSLTATITTIEPHGFVTGQSVVITESGSAFNGTYTITDTDASLYTFDYVVASGADQTEHLVRPYGVVTGAFQATTYGTVPEIREASIMIATDVWQARNSSNSGGVSPDFQPSPYKMGNTLTARVRGLLANHISPKSLVG